MYDDNNDNGEKREDLMQKENVTEQKRKMEKKLCVRVDRYERQCLESDEVIRRRTRE